MGTHSSALAWRIPGTGEPSGLPSMGSHRVGHSHEAYTKNKNKLLDIPKIVVILDKVVTNVSLVR